MLVDSKGIVVAIMLTPHLSLCPWCCTIVFYDRNQNGGEAQTIVEKEDSGARGDIMCPAKDYLPPQLLLYTPTCHRSTLFAHAACQD